MLCKKLQRTVIISDKEIVFSGAFVCLSVSITQKVMYGL